MRAEQSVRRRPTWRFVGALLITIALGLGTRQFPSVFPPVVARYGGDVLWATMMFWLLALLYPAAPTHRLALSALTISFAVECSQLYRAPWIDSVRANPLGALVLGQGFLWSDLLCYTIGVLLAMFIDGQLQKVR